MTETVDTDAALKAALADGAAAIEQQLNAMMDQCAAAATAPGRQRLVAAMRHAALAGGKRIRPFLVVTASGLSLDHPGVAAAAQAIELIHCYSLVHDDLPSMDNDTLRRGKPTVHVAYDEATAILAGDGLLTLAFQAIAAMEDAALAHGLSRIIAAASGEAGMIGGQMLDLDAEGRFDPAGGSVPEHLRTPKRLPLSGIAEVQALKTGALIRAAVEMGALCRGIRKGHDEHEALARYSASLGLAFQISDDLIDAIGDAQTAGKAVAKDKQAGKATFVSALGIEGARQRLANEIADGTAALRGMTGEAMLAALLQSMASRTS
jgi:farnesyl diphosphate synthase